ncbi:MAG: PilZ domain-containing protein, partial [Polyangiaceae bacterium]
MSGTEDRRAPGAARIAFDALVEVGGALGPSFEAQAINVSEDGIQLRTAYLPEPGQPLTCRFDGGPGKNVLAAGEVVWAKGEERGGEFGVRFTDVDSEGVDALKRLCGMNDGATAADAVPVVSGSKVRLHIDGLASPMRAKIKDSRATEVTVGSDLGFLQVGKALELEDAQSGGKRPACIDRVEVAVDPTSHVPQLVVTLRYADAQAESDAAHAASAAAASAPGINTKPGDDLASMEEASAQMKGAFARKMAGVGPAMQRFASQARLTMALLAQRRKEKAAPPRTTAPAPGGGLHSSGRRVVRGEAPSSPGDTVMPPRMAI